MAFVYRGISFNRSPRIISLRISLGLFHLGSNPVS